MKRAPILSLLLLCTLFGDRLTIDRLRTTLPDNRQKDLINADISLVLEGRDLKTERFKVMDVIQAALGRYDAQSLLTSQGKDHFKKDIVDLADKRYGIEIDFVYIQNIRLEIDTLQRCLELIRRQRGMR